MEYRKKLCFLLLVILLLFAACTPEKPDASLSSDEATLFSMADNRKSCETLIQDTPTLETIYKYSRFGAYFSARAHSAGYTIAEVNEIQKIECLRRKDNGDYYAVFQPKEGGRVYTFFAKQDGYLMSHSIYLLEPLDRNAFEKLQAGDTFADVLPLDPAIRKCLENGMWCNVITLQDGFYSVHLFEDAVALISYEGTSDDVPPEQMVIREVKWFENRELFIDAPENLIHGAYDYSILPQDYVN